MKALYLETTAMIERLHRHFLEVIKAELDREGVRDVNNVQALILFNIGDDELTIGELTNRGYYLGSNVSYNVKKLVENDYLIQERSEHDRRSVRVRLSEKAKDLTVKLDAMFGRQAETLSDDILCPEELESATRCLMRLAQFWSGTIEMPRTVPDVRVASVA